MTLHISQGDEGLLMLTHQHHQVENLVNEQILATVSNGMLIWLIDMPSSTE